MTLQGFQEVPVLSQAMEMFLRYLSEFPSTLSKERPGTRGKDEKNGAERCPGSQTRLLHTLKAAQ